MNIKTLNNLNYYKDPFFLNDFNLRNQLEILKAINNEKVDLSKNFMEENLPTIYNITHNNMFSKTHNTDINDYYNRVFKMKPLFRKIKPVVDNKLNMRYAENEEQYRKIMEKEQKVFLSQGKKIKVVETPIIFDERMFGESKRLLFAFFIAYTTSILHLSGLRLKAAFKRK